MKPKARARASLLRRPWLWMSIFVLVAVGAFAAYEARGPRVTTVRASHGPLEQHVVASGRVMPPARINVAANVSGLVIAVGAVEGHHVEPGELLVQIDDGEARAQVAEAKAVVGQASARVDQLRRVGAIVASQGLNEAQANLGKAQTDFERTQALVTSGALAAVELENARRTLDVARAQKNAAEAQQLGSAAMGAESRVALSALLQAKAQLAGAEVRLAQTRITAAQGGVVLTRSVETGDTVQPGRVLMTIASDGDVELVFEPDERNLATIRLGQRARASADAFPQEIFAADVSYIAPSIDPARGTVEVRLRVPAPPTYLKPDMTISIDLTVAAKQDALVLRSDAVRGAGTPSPWVLVVTNGRAERKDVKVGIQGDGSLEIASGLPEGAEVIVADAQTISPGARVRPSRAEP